MVHRLIGVTGLVLLWAGFANAQTPAKTAEQLTKDVLELQQKVANTAENVRLLAEQVVKNTEADTTSSKEIERLAGVISDELKKQEAILAKLDVLMQQQQEQLARQQAILDAIVHKDASGRDVLQLSATMEQSEEFREDVRKAVHQALQTHGELTIWNRMSTRQQIVVNQKPYEIDPDEILMVTAPVGTVSAQLPGQGLTNWTLSAPTYSQKIEIVPQSDADSHGGCPANHRTSGGGDGAVAKPRPADAGGNFIPSCRPVPWIRRSTSGPSSDCRQSTGSPSLARLVAATPRCGCGRSAEVRRPSLSFGPVRHT